MISIEVQGLNAVQGLLQRFPETVRGEILQPALNKTLDKARAEIARALPQEFHVKAAEVRSSLRLTRARSGRLEASIDLFGSPRKRGRSLNLIHFLAAVQGAGQARNVRGTRLSRRDLRGLQGQLGFLIRRGAGLKQIPGAFLANRGRTIFRRTNQDDPRSAIEPVQVVGYSQMFASQRISERVKAKLRADLPGEVARSIARLQAMNRL